MIKKPNDNIIFQDSVKPFRKEANKSSSLNMSNESNVKQLLIKSSDTQTLVTIFDDLKL